MVIDASALLALLFNEQGAATVREHIHQSYLSTVNATEVITTLCDRGMPITEAQAIVSRLVPNIISFDPEQSFLAGSLRNQTRHLGLSLGDRACLALAITLHDTALTADRVWSQLSVTCKIECIR